MSGATEAPPRAQLLCRTGELAGQTHELTRSNVIGRNSDNDVVLHSSLISGKHARIWEKDGSFFVEDLGSSNGTWVDGIRITDPVRLDRLNVITFAGAFDFVFAVPETAGRPPSEAETASQASSEADSGTTAAATVRLETKADTPPDDDAQRTRLDMDFQPLPDLEDQQEKARALPAYRLEATLPDGRQQAFDVETGSYTLGRSADCDITVDDPSISRHHANLTVGDALVLEDADSVNGTLVDGSEIDRTELAPNSTFSLGPFVEIKVTKR